MNSKHQNKLIAQFPDMCSERKLPSAFAFGFECGDGWFDLILDLMTKIDRVDKNVRIAQVKEKFGGLRFYVDCANDEAHQLINKAESHSYHICEGCGEPGTLTQGGWLRTECPKCREERAKSNRKEAKPPEKFDLNLWPF